jgi:hypothetical protein
MENKTEKTDKLAPMGGALGKPAYDKTAPMGGLMPGSAGGGLTSGGLTSGGLTSGGLTSGSAGSGLTSGGLMGLQPYDKTAPMGGLMSGPAGSGLTSIHDGTINRIDSKYRNRLAREAEEKLPESVKRTNFLEKRLKSVEKWQNTAQGQDGIEIKGNVFTAKKNPQPFVPPVQGQNFTTDVLVIAPSDFINYFATPSPTEINTAVPWPDGTACTVDIGAQDPQIGFLGYRVFSGNLYLRWTCFTGSGRSLSEDITITAFLTS